MQNVTATERPRSVASGALTLAGREVAAHVLSDGRAVLMAEPVVGVLGPADGPLASLVAVEFELDDGAVVRGFDSVLLVDALCAYRVAARAYPPRGRAARERHERVCEFLRGLVRAGLRGLARGAA